MSEQETPKRAKKPSRSPEEMRAFYQEKADEAQRKIAAAEIVNGNPCNKAVIRLRKAALKVAADLLEADYLEEVQAACQNLAEQIAEDLLSG